MRNVILFCIAFLFLVACNNTFLTSKRDFYGTRRCENITAECAIAFKLKISKDTIWSLNAVSSTFNMAKKGFRNKVAEIFDLSVKKSDQWDKEEKMDIAFPILKWEKIKNAKEKTNDEFSNGYKIFIEVQGVKTAMKIFKNINDKNKIAIYWWEEDNSDLNVLVKE